MNMPRVKIVLVALTVFLVLIQVIQPARTNPQAAPARALAAHVRVPEGVYATLLRSCGDCHSNQTHWPWYSRIAPLSWVITDDVNEGRRHMNFEDWEAQADPKEGNDHLSDICPEIEKKGMPLFSYRLLHGDNRLNPSEIVSICKWSDSFRGAPAQPRANPAMR
jgi:hypothetical protein